jgi:hypothetical protein
VHACGVPPPGTCGSATVAPNESSSPANRPRRIPRPDPSPRRGTTPRRGFDRTMEGVCPMLRDIIAGRPRVLLLAGLVALAGCGDASDPTAPNDGAPVPETGTEDPATPGFPGRSATEVLVPDGDLTEYVGWPAIPDDPAEAWSKVDEGVANLNIYDFIYSMYHGDYERFTFTDLTESDVVVTRLEFVIPLNVGLDEALEAGLTITYYIDDNEEGSDTYTCGEISEISCGDTTWVATFDDVCYTDEEIATLELELESVGTWWSPAMTQVLITAIDCEVTYDEELEISNLSRTFDGLDCEAVVTWDTNVASSSTVHWGTHPSQLNNVATGAGNTTSHTVTIDATGISYNTRIYTKAESATDCDEVQSGTGFVYRNYCISE